MGFYEPLKNALRSCDYTKAADEAKYFDIETVADEYSLTKKQLKFVMRLYNNNNYFKEMEKWLDGCIKQKMYNLFCLLAIDKSNLVSVCKSIKYYFDDIPEELRAPLMAICCYRSAWSNPTYIQLLSRSLENYQMPERSLDDLPDEVTVYKAIPWSKTIKEMIHLPYWSLSYEDQARYCVSTMYQGANDNPEKLKLYDAGAIEDVNTCCFRIIKAKVKKESILARENASELGYAKSDNVLIKDEVYGVDLVRLKETIESFSKEFERRAETMENVAAKQEKNSSDSIFKYEKGLFLRNDTKETLLNRTSKTIKDFGLQMIFHIEEELYDKGVPRVTDYDEIKDIEINSSNQLIKLARAFDMIPDSMIVPQAKEILEDCGNATLIRKVYNDKLKFSKGKYYLVVGYSMYAKELIWMIGKTSSKNSAQMRYFIDQNKIPNTINNSKLVIPLVVWMETAGKTMEDVVHNASKLLVDKSKESKIISEINLKALPDDIETEIDNDKALKISDEQKALIQKDKVFEEMDAEYSDKLEKLENETSAKSAEIEKLQKKLSDMMQENEDLKSKVQMLENEKNRTDDIIQVHIGNEAEKYNDEAKTQILLAVENEYKHCASGSRRKDVLKSILGANESIMEIHKIRKQNINAITNDFSYAENIKGDLKNIGFEYIYDGKHPKIRFPDDERYYVTMASTPSDKRRGGKNLAALINSKFF